MAALAVGLALATTGAPEAWHRMSGRPWDGQQEWWLARFFLDGADPYSPAGLARINIGYLGHPPTSAFYALPFALFSAVLAWYYKPGFSWLELAGILLCMTFARSAAIAFNRIVDRDVDALNPRTAGRHRLLGDALDATLQILEASDDFVGDAEPEDYREKCASNRQRRWRLS